MEKPANLDSGLHLFIGSGSPYARRVQLCLLHKKLQFQCHLLSFSDRDNRRDWFLALNPRGQVPLLLHDGVPVTQSLAILLYVEDKFPSTPLLPSDSVEKARVIAHVCEMDDKLHRDVEHDIFHRGLKKEIDESVRKELNEKVDKELGVWETYLEKNGTGFLVGSSFTIADAALLPFLALVSTRLGLDFTARSIPMPRLKAYFEKLSAMDAVEASVPPHWRTSSPPAQPFAAK